MAGPGPSLQFTGQADFWHPTGPHNRHTPLLPDEAADMPGQQTCAAPVVVTLPAQLDAAAAERALTLKKQQLRVAEQAQHNRVYLVTPVLPTPPTPDARYAELASQEYRESCLC